MIAPSLARLCISDAASRFMTDDMGLAPSTVADRLAAARRPETPLVEYAHTPQFPHLGIARASLTADKLARSLNGVLVFFVNDHIAPRELQECRQISILKNGLSVKNPPTLAIKKNAAKCGMSWLPAPNVSTLANIKSRLIELCPSNADSIQLLHQNLSLAARESRTLSGFFMRFWAVTLDLDALFVPTSALGAHPPLLDLALATTETWLYCEECGYRIGRIHSAPCPHCGSGHGYRRIPDVIGRQITANQACLDRRVCGTSKPYQEAADALSKQLGCPPPMRYPIVGSVSTILDGTDNPAQRVNLCQWMIQGRSHDLDRLRASPPSEHITLI